MDNYNIQEYNFGTDNTHLVYIPENVNKDTEIIYVAFNDKREKKYNNKWQALEEGIQNFGTDKIIIYPENPDLNPGSQNYQTEANKVFHAIKEDYNLNTNQFVNAGHSAGAGWSIKNLTVFLKENPNVERQTLFLLDSQLDKKFTNEEMELIKENNTMIISYCQPYRRDHEIKNLALKTGLPILFVEDPDIPQYSSQSWGYYHNVVVENFFTKGLYNSLTNYSQGKGELPEWFKYKIYNPKTNRIEDIDPKDAATFFGINKIYGNNYLFFDLSLKEIFTSNSYLVEDVSSEASNKYSFLKDLKEYYIYNLSNSTVSSDIQYIQSFANGIINSIKSDSLFESTTMNIAGGCGPLTSVINECLTLYYDSVGHLLDSLSKEADAIVSIGQSLVDLDTHLNKEVEETIAPSVELSNLSETANNVQISNVNDGASSSSSIQTNNNEIVNTINTQPKDENKENNPTSNKNEENSNDNHKENKLEKEPDEEKNKKESKNETNSEVSKEETNKEVSKSEELDTNKNQNTSTSSNPNNNNNNGYSNNKNYSSNNSINNTSEITYDKGDYNVIFETKGDEVISMKYQYDYDSYEKALSNYEMLLIKLKDNENIENIILNGNRIEIIFKNNVYENIDINKLLELNLIEAVL